MKKIRINMLSIANKVKGQGVSTAYNELINLLKDKEELDISINSGLKYDIMHAHTLDIKSYIKQRFSKGKSLTYVHFLPNTLQGALKLPKFIHKIFYNWALNFYKKSDYLVVVNPDYIETLSKLGIDKNKIYYIPNYVSNKSFYPMNKKEINYYRKKYGYSNSDFIVICVGQLHKGKGIFDFVECAKANPDIKFLWVGGFNFGKFMEGYSEVKDIYENPPKNLKFSGIVPREDVNILCNISDVFFLPSYVESFALVAIEAANTHKPIVLRDIEVYKNLYFDKYLKGNNNDDFNKILRKLKSNKDLYNKYKNNSIDIANYYNESNIYKKWLDLYIKICKI